jgi:hypothetical protein
MAQRYFASDSERRQSKMRKSLWMIPVVLLFTALGSTTARADTIACGTATCITTGGYVTEIEGLNIDGTAYNVTFDTTDSSPAPFNTNGEAGDASGAIIAALGGDEIVNASLYGGVLQLIAVDAGGGSAYIDYLSSGGGWAENIGVYSIARNFTPYVPDGGLYFADFSTAATATPEPGTLLLTLTGVGLLGLMVVMRKRKALGLAQTA